MKEVYSGFLALDGSVLIGLALGEKGFDELKNALLNETAIGLAHELAVTELLYIICRKSSMEKALEKFNYLKLSGYINIVSINELIESAAELKCSRALALADCFTLALARKYSGRALFAKAEDELLREIKREAFDVDIIFVLDSKIVKRGERRLVDL